MKQLREFLNQQIEAFLNFEFGPMQNMTPEGIRRILWEPEHTARLVGHLAGNWEMVEEALRVRQNARPLPKRHGGLHHVTCASCPVGFGCGCAYPNNPHLCMGCDTQMEAAADNAQADAAAAEWDAAPEDERPRVNPEVPW